MSVTKKDGMRPVALALWRRLTIRPQAHSRLALGSLLLGLSLLYVPGLLPAKAVAQQASSAALSQYNALVQEQLDLIVNDPVSQLFTFTQYLAVNNLLILQQSVHDAVGNCLTLFGPFCNPYVDGGSDALAAKL